ncbi:MAG: hypothetical protein SR2Q5_01130 [Quinella sp. 2Q5]|nr:hypothetical protein [Quinella sp. 2Q5]
MTEQERINENLQRQIDAQNARTDAVLIKVEDLVREMKDFKAEMRQQNQMRAEDMREIRQTINNMQNNINDMGKHVRNLSLTAMGAIGAMVVTVIISLLR